MGLPEAGQECLLSKNNVPTAINQLSFGGFRVPVRIAIERDDRWAQLRAGLSVRVAIEHGPGDPAWAGRAAREMTAQESRYNQPPQNPGAAP